MADLLTTWSRRITTRIAAKVADARAHAAKAVTDVLRNTPDGRPTIRRAKSSVSFQAAQNRLSELTAELAGPSIWSREGLLRDAYAELYAASVQRWWPLVPESLRVAGDGRATAANLVRARALAPHGTDPRAELASVVEALRGRLHGAIVQTASAGPSPLAGGLDRLAAWELAARTAITRTAVLLLGDAEVALDRQAGVDLVRPEMIDRTPLEVD